MLTGCCCERHIGVQERRRDDISGVYFKVREERCVAWKPLFDALGIAKMVGGLLIYITHSHQFTGIDHLPCMEMARRGHLARRANQGHAELLRTHSAQSHSGDLSGRP